MPDALGRGADRPEAHEVYCVSLPARCVKKTKKSKKPDW